MCGVLSPWMGYEAFESVISNCVVVWCHDCEVRQVWMYVIQ